MKARGATDGRGDAGHVSWRVAPPTPSRQRAREPEKSVLEASPPHPPAIGRPFRQGVADRQTRETYGVKLASLCTALEEEKQKLTDAGSDLGAGEIGELVAAVRELLFAFACIGNIRSQLWVKDLRTKAQKDKKAELASGLERLLSLADSGENTFPRDEQGHSYLEVACRQLLKRHQDGPKYRGSWGAPLAPPGAAPGVAPTAAAPAAGTSASLADPCAAAPASATAAAQAAESAAASAAAPAEVPTAAPAGEPTATEQPAAAAAVSAPGAPAGGSWSEKLESQLEQVIDADLADKEEKQKVASDTPPEGTPPAPEAAAAEERGGDEERPAKVPRREHEVVAGAVAARDELSHQQADLQLFSGGTGPSDEAAPEVRYPRQRAPRGLQPAALAFESAVMAGVGGQDKGDVKAPAPAAARGVAALARTASRAAAERPGKRQRK